MTSLFKMENPAKFPLLHLPRVALDEVISMMVPFELLNLSKISPRTEMIVKILPARKRTYTIYLAIIGIPDVIIHGSKMKWMLKLTQDFTNNEVNYTYPRDIQLKHLYESYGYINRILNCSIKKVLYLPNPFIDGKSITDWLKSQQKTVETLNIVSELSSYGNDVEYLLSNVKATKSMRLVIDNKRNFKWDELLPKNLDLLSVEASNGINYQQLLRMNCSNIILSKSKLTSRQINLFLKRWMASESHLNLEAFEINIKNHEAMNTILDLPHQKVRYENGRVFENDRVGMYQVFDGIEIKQSSDVHSIDRIVMSSLSKMDNPATFPLLHLPRVALDEVISIMIPLELINFSKISPRTEMIVKTLPARKRTYTIFLTIIRIPSVTIHGSKMNWRLELTQDFTNNKVNYTYPRDIQLKHIYESYGYIRRSLNCSIKEVLYLPSPFIDYKSVIDWLKAQQKSVEELQILSLPSYDNDVKYMLSNVKATECLRITIDNKQYFKWDELLPKNLDLLYLEALNGINYQQLLRMNCSNILLVNSKITSRQINLFLKRWMASESHLNLKTFEVNIENHEAMNTILDLPHQKVKYENGRVFGKHPDAWERAVASIIYFLNSLDPQFQAENFLELRA
ncbi:unnamed protein product [Caenorhabditis brenneri]